MRVYKEIDIAEACAPFEVADWIYLGRIPELIPDDYGSDVRTNIRALTEEMSIKTEDYTRSELAAYGIHVDMGFYWDATSDISAEVYFKRDFDSERGEWVEFQGPPPPDYFPRKFLVDDINEKMRAPREQAQLETLLALMGGKLVAYGFKIPEGWEWEDGEPAHPKEGALDSWLDLFERAKVEPIPSSFWRNIPDIWEYGGGIAHPPSFIGCWVSTLDVFRLFPQPKLTALPLNLDLYADCGVVIESQGTSSLRPVPSGKGRKPKGDGVLQKAIVFEFKRRRDAGELPVKQEAVIVECIQWVKDALGEDIGRSTAQRHLAQINAQI